MALIAATDSDEGIGQGGQNAEKIIAESGCEMGCRLIEQPWTLKPDYQSSARGRRLTEGHPLQERAVARKCLVTHLELIDSLESVFCGLFDDQYSCSVQK